jgi:hypothetical protein
LTLSHLANYETQTEATKPMQRYVAEKTITCLRHQVNPVT